MRACRMRSRPSRSCVPGATRRRATIMASDRGWAGTADAHSAAASGNDPQASPTRWDQPAGINAPPRRERSPRQHRPVDAAGAPHAGGDDRAPEPETRRLRRAAGRAAAPTAPHRPSRARRSRPCPRDDRLLAPRARRPRARARGRAPRLGDAQPTGDARVDVGAARRHPAVLLEHRQQHRETRRTPCPPPTDAAAGSRAPPTPGPPRASDARPRAPPPPPTRARRRRRSRRNRADASGTSARPWLGHLEQAELVGAPEAVLRARAACAASGRGRRRTRARCRRRARAPAARRGCPPS